MHKSDSAKRCKLIIKNYSLPPNSWASFICHVIFDALLVSSFVYLVYRIFFQDWEYWQTAPTPFYWFLLIQYFLLAAAMRVPVSQRVTPNQQTRIMGFVTCILFISTIFGLVMLNQIA
jgi:hypothetical protein